MCACSACLFSFDSFKIRLEALSCGFLLIVCGKMVARRLLAFDFFSSDFTLERFSCGLLLVVCEENVFFLIFVVCCVAFVPLFSFA